MLARFAVRVNENLPPPPPLLPPPPPSPVVSIDPQLDRSRWATRSTHIVIPISALLISNPAPPADLRTIDLVFCRMHHRAHRGYCRRGRGRKNIGRKLLDAHTHTYKKKKMFSSANEMKGQSFHRCGSGLYRSSGPAVTRNAQPHDARVATIKQPSAPNLRRYFRKAALRASAKAQISARLIKGNEIRMRTVPSRNPLFNTGTPI